MRRVLALCLVVLALPAAAEAGPGDLDETFSRDGLIADGMPDSVVDLAVGPDDSVLVATQKDNEPVLYRYTAEGNRDPAFAGAPVRAAVASLDIRSNGRILVGGTSAEDFVIAELDPNGVPVCSAAYGCAQTDFASGRDVLKDVVAEPGGGTLAAGLVTDATGAHLGVARYLPAGGLDDSFSGDGKLIFDSGGTPTPAENAVVAGLLDGSVLLAGAGPGPDGSGRGDLLLAKLEPDGDLDAGFGGGDGWVTVDVAGRDDAESMAVAPDGSILVGIRACAIGLHTDCDGAVARFSAAGELDSSFGDGGVLAGPGGDVAVGADGAIYATGQSRILPYFSYDFALARYLPTGAADPGFSEDGTATADFGLSHDSPVSLELTSSGQPVVLGYVGGGSEQHNRLGLARFEVADGPPDADADGRLDQDDRCPARYATNRSACPRIGRELRLRRTGGRLLAVLRSPVDLCVARAPVQLVRVSPGPDRRVASGRTSRSGRWTVGKDVPDGLYRVRAKAKLAKPVGRCGNAHSEPRRAG